jgi:hypothetical protein
MEFAIKSNLKIRLLARHSYASEYPGMGYLRRIVDNDGKSLGPTWIASLITRRLTFKQEYVSNVRSSSQLISKKTGYS